MASDKKVFSYSHKKYMETLYFQGGVSLDPRGLMLMIFVGHHMMLLQTKYISCGLLDLKFSLGKSVGIIDPHCDVSLDPKDLIDRIYVGDH